MFVGDGLAERPEQADRIRQEAASLHPIANRGEQLLLAPGPVKSLSPAAFGRRAKARAWLPLRWCRPAVMRKAVRVAVLVVGRVAEAVRHVDATPPSLLTTLMKP
jgi:hypothetical protein